VVTIDLTDDEAAALVALLDARLGELSEEIYHATVSSFKDELKTLRRTLETVREKVAAARG